MSDESPPRTVTPARGARHNTQMSLIGHLIFAGVLVLLLPLLPFLCVLKLLTALRSSQ